MAAIADNGCVLLPRALLLHDAAMARPARE
jgi:hypothetical protein